MFDQKSPNLEDGCISGVTHLMKWLACGYVPVVAAITTDLIEQVGHVVDIIRYDQAFAGEDAGRDRVIA